VADQKNEKSPEELGEAVGRKIEALFGGFFGDDETQLLADDATAKKDAPVAEAPAPAAKRPQHTDTIEIAPPVAMDEAETVVAPAIPVPASAPERGAVPSPDQGQPFEDVAELIEALILNLEWEVTPEVITEVADRFKEMDVYFPGDTRARNVLSMNYRVLQRFNNPDGSSHPSLVKMLQDSLTVLKLIKSSPGNRQSIDSLITGINNMYKLISAATANVEAPSAPKPALKAVPSAPKTPPPAPAAPPKPAPVPAKPAAAPGKTTAPMPKPAAPAKKPAVPQPAGKTPPAAAAPAKTAAKAPALKEKLSPDPHRILAERVEAAVTSLEEMGHRITRIVGVLRHHGESVGEEFSTGTMERLLGPTDEQIGFAFDTEGAELYQSLMKKSGSALQSLEEVSQRFSRILGVFRQGGDMSGEEIIRRLGTLEHLFSERLGQLSSFHRQLSGIPVSSSEGGDKSGPKTISDGLVTLIWAGTPLAIPSTLVTALFPISKAQADQLKDKTTIVLGGRSVQRLPLKRPPKAGQTDTVPLWVVHVTVGQKDFFLLAERSLGYRRTPAGVDISRQSRVQLGETSFAVLNQSSFR
jgi:hypothetical protein